MVREYQILPSRSPLKKKINKNQDSTTVLIRETEGLFKEGVGRGVQLLRLQGCLGKDAVELQLLRLLVSEPVRQPIPLICLFASCLVISHIGPRSCPERPANKARFSVGIEHQRAAVLLSKHRRATSSGNKGVFHYLAAGAGSGSHRAFVWRALKYAKFPLHGKGRRALGTQEHILSHLRHLSAGFLSSPGRWKPVR